MTKDRLISAMSRFCPPIIGECPKCGDPIFDGYRCFRCGFDASTKKSEKYKMGGVKMNEKLKTKKYKMGGVKMNEKLKTKKVIFCDLDGTLIETISGETFPKGIWDMRIKFDALDAIKKLNPEYILIVSNQGGIESGFVDRDDFRSKSEYITRAVREYCGCECYGIYCETNDKADPYRKPNTKMLEDLLEKYVGDDFDFIKQKSIMIGDASGKEGQFSDSDKKTAENFGIDYMDVNDFVNIDFGN